MQQHKFWNSKIQRRMIQRDSLRLKMHLTGQDLTVVLIQRRVE